MYSKKPCIHSKEHRNALRRALYTLRKAQFSLKKALYLLSEKPYVHLKEPEYQGDGG